jgi:hypothetical protein
MSEEISNAELGILSDQRAKSKQKAKSTSSLSSTLEFASYNHLKFFVNRMKARFSKKFNIRPNLDSLTCKIDSIKGAEVADKERYLKWHQNYARQFPGVDNG